MATDNTIRIELRLESQDPRRTTATLVEQIAGAEPELLTVLTNDATSVTIEPQATFPGSELIWVAIVVVLKGAGTAAGAELSKPVAQKVVGWIKNRFGNVNVTEPSESQTQKRESDASKD